jgi:hypothetical protein
MEHNFTMTIATALLSRAIDYAGLFPPASLDMGTAIRNYADYRRSSNAWALGRFIVPTTRLHEFHENTVEAIDAWPLSLLTSSNIKEDLQIASDRKMHVEVVECKVRDIREIGMARKAIPEDVIVYFEIPIHDDPSEWIAAIAGTGSRVKVRTGGITSDAFPSPLELARFIKACAGARVPFKATAGLHHPVRSLQRLTYEHDSASAVMHGFVNVFFAGALLYFGATLSEAVAVLEDQCTDSWKYGGDEMCWRSWRITTSQMQAVRDNLAISFGSCSFGEPLSEMDALGWK